MTPLESLISQADHAMRQSYPYSPVWHRHHKLRAERVREWRQSNTLKGVR